MGLWIWAGLANDVNRCKCGTWGDPDIDIILVHLDEYQDTWTNIETHELISGHLVICTYFYGVLSYTKIFYIWQPYFLSHLWSFMYSSFGCNICFCDILWCEISYIWPPYLWIPCLADIFFLFMPITFEIVHKCVSVYNANAYEVQMTFIF